MRELVNHLEAIDLLDIRVRDLMSPTVISVQEKDMVVRAAAIMSRKKVSSVLVREGKTYVGILTDRDLIERVISKGKDSRKLRVGSIMSSPLLMIRDIDTIEDAASMMRKNGVRRLVVEREGKIVGVIAESDIVRVDPELHFLIREQSKLEAKLTPAEPKQVALAGFCEECSNYSSGLLRANEIWLCEDCRD